jgi:hypothetical protein
MMRQIADNRIRSHLEARVQDGHRPGKHEVIDPVRKTAQCGRHDPVEIVMGHDLHELPCGRGLVRSCHENGLSSSLDEPASFSVHPVRITNPLFLDKRSGNPHEGIREA